MSGGMPELGSKISLISKADIRYEGRLYTVDPQECTIALSSVRSFGTEDRETQFQIAPQSQIYDYILFRGSDIKDIRVINNSLPHPNDPAIMQVQLPNGQHVMPHFSMPNMNTPQVPPMGTSASYGNPFGTMSSLGAIGGSSGAAAVASLAPGAPGPFMLGGNQQAVQPQPKPSQGQQPQTQQKAPSCNTTDTNNLVTSSLLTTVDSIGANLNNSNSAHNNTNSNPNTNTNNNSNSNQSNNAINNGGLLGIGLGIGSGGLLSNIGLGIGGSVVGNNSSTTSATSSTTKKISLTSATALNDPKDQDMLAGASRSTTPISLISRKSPSADIGVQVNQNQNQQQQQQQQTHQQQQQPQHQPHHHSNQTQIHQQQQQQQQANHPNHQNNASHGQSRDAGHKRQNHPTQRGGNQQRNNDNYRSGRMMDNYNNINHYNQRSNNPGGNQNRNNWNTHRGNMPNNMRTRGGAPRSNMRNIMAFRTANGPGSMQKPSRNPIKFEQDFDFEQANTKFEELRSQLSKLKVGDDPKSEQMNGETDKKDDSGNETGAGEHEPEEEEITVGYDKTKSFFDNISCETAQDRTKSKNYDWRQERKLNSETFGVSSTRRGGYRGRGNYYNNRNINYNNGGYNNRGYRGNNYRNRSNNRSKMHNNRDGSTSNGIVGGSNTTNIVNNPTANNVVANLKNQAQQLTTPGSASNHIANTTPATTSKTVSSSLQETNNQSQMAAVGAGQ